MIQLLLVESFVFAFSVCVYGDTVSNATTSSAAAASMREWRPETSVTPARRYNDDRPPLTNVMLVRNLRIKSGRSTSSSSGELKAGAADASGSSLQVSDDTSSSSKETKFRGEGKGWRKWHRKCTPCPNDIATKWRQPKIRWICGAYQRARRSFKSACMMRYRNCQDGTMFVKIHSNRCKNSSSTEHGTHFFYDYKVTLSLDDSGKSDSRDSSEEESSESSESTSSS